MSTTTILFGNDLCTDNQPATPSVPFMGIGSTAYVAVQEGRDAVGFELKESYYEQSLANVRKAEEELRLASSSMALPMLALIEQVAGVA